MSRLRAAAAVLILPLLGLAPPRDAGGPQGWKRVGDPAAAKVDPAAGRVTLSVSDDRTIAGALSAGTVSLAGSAVVVSADVSAAPAGGVTFAVVDAASGDSLAHWRSPRPIDAPTRITAVLELADAPATASGRVFVGTHHAASTADISGVQVAPTRKRMAAYNATYGALVDGSRSAGQVFRAGGRKLDAVVFRVRQLGLDHPDGPDLRVAVYAWRGPDKGRGDRPLVERLVPRRMVPPVGSGEIEVAVPFGTSITPGQPYFLEFSPAGPCDPSAAFLLYCGDDSYPHGFRCENGAATADKWDLYLRTFESE